MRRIVALAVALAAGFLQYGAGAAEPHSVVLFIGDGMGPAHVLAGRLFLGKPLAFEGFPHHAVVTTRSANAAVTDSAAAATAIATGHKVNNGVLSLALPGDGQPLQTLLEHFRARGKSTGLVTTTHLTHATPAAFGAHRASRGDVTGIAADYLQVTRPDVMFGGGGYGLDPASAGAMGYLVATNGASLKALNSVGGRMAGLFGAANMPYEADGLGDLPALDEMVTAALARLDDDPDGFFLMVEGGRIDHAAHANDLVRTVGEVLGFNRAVAAALAWAEKRGDVLVLVTADHETGGLRVLADRGPGQYPEAAWFTSGHTAVPVDLYAWGARSGLAEACRDNTDIYRMLADLAFPPPRLAKVRSMDDQLEIGWHAASGRVYRVEWVVRVNGLAWQPLRVITADRDGVQTLRMGNLAPTGFFRVVEEP